MRLRFITIVLLLASVHLPALAQSKSDLEADVLFAGIRPGVAPERVMRVAQRVLAGRNFVVSEKPDGTIIGHYISGKTEMELHVVLADDALRFIAVDGNGKAMQIPERWLANLRADLKEAIGVLTPGPAGGHIATPGGRLGTTREVLFVRVPAVLDPAAPIAEAVLRECNVESMIATNAIFGIRGKYLGRTQMARGESKGRELRLTILEASGVGPGNWVRKAITLRADMTEGSRILASKTFDLETRLMSGVALRSTCTTLGDVSVQLGRQIGQWANIAMAGLSEEPSSPSAIGSPPAAARQATNSADRLNAELRAVEVLEKLQKQREEGEIGGAEYERRRAQILNGL